MKLLDWRSGCGWDNSTGVQATTLLRPRLKQCNDCRAITVFRILTYFPQYEHLPVFLPLHQPTLLLMLCFAGRSHTPPWLWGTGQGSEWIDNWSRYHRAWTTSSRLVWHIPSNSMLEWTSKGISIVDWGKEYVLISHLISITDSRTHMG